MSYRNATQVYISTSCMSNSLNCWTSHSAAVSLCEEFYTREKETERATESLISFEGGILGMLGYLFTEGLPKMCLFAVFDFFTER